MHLLIHAGINHASPTANMDEHYNKGRRLIFLDVDAPPGSIDYELVQILKDRILNAAEDIKGQEKNVTYERLANALQKNRKQLSRWVERLGIREQLGLRNYSRS